MAHEQIEVETADGLCPTHLMTPEGEGPWPGVIFFTDAGGIRPASIAMARRLADRGYVVLMPDIFYRYGPYDPIEPIKAFAGDFRAVIAPLVATTSYRKAADDARPLLDLFGARADVQPKRYGVTGYCMGGAIALTAAGLFPERIAAAASFHGGSLATDDAISPHLLVPNITAEVYIGVADNDASYPPTMGDRLKAALDDAGITYRHELYPGALHGWTQTDFPIYDEPAAERHWRELLALLERTIG